jgi:hypothetical protein
MLIQPAHLQVLAQLRSSQAGQQAAWRFAEQPGLEKIQRFTQPARLRRARQVQGKTQVQAGGSRRQAQLQVLRPQRQKWRSR